MKDWTVTVTVPEHLSEPLKDMLFAHVVDAVSEWEPLERDGWDAHVVTGPADPADDLWVVEAGFSLIGPFATEASAREWLSRMPERPGEKRDVFALTPPSEAGLDAVVGNDGLTNAERAEYLERWLTGAGALPSAEASRRAAVALGTTTHPEES